MKEIEELLRRDRESDSLPEAPSARYTVAVIQRRLQPIAKPARQQDDVEWLLLFALVCTVALAVGAMLLGLHPLWLILLPLLSMAVIPLVFQKGV